MDLYFIHHTPLVQKTNTEITFDKVDKVYIGKGNCCRCGCGGEYYTAEENPEEVKKALDKLSSGKYDVVSQDDYIFEIETSCTKKGNTKVICLYLKK
jgi:hypothetical protein